MARTKFTFEKRQREIARQQKQKDKAARRAEAKQLKDDAPPNIRIEDPTISGFQPSPAPEDHEASAKEGAP
jgi:hypothetical protein